MTTDRIQFDEGDDDLDEIVVRDVTVHMEKMDDTTMWIGIYKDHPELGRFMLMVNLYVTPEGRLRTTIDDEGDSPWPWNWDPETLEADK